MKMKLEDGLTLGVFADFARLGTHRTPITDRFVREVPADLPGFS